MNTEPPHDSFALTALRAGEPAEFDRLLATMQQRLLTFAWRYLHNSADAEDVVIETFVRLHQARQRLREDTNLRAWLYTTVANLCHNRHRWRVRHPEVSLERQPAEEWVESPTRAPDATLQRDEVAQAVREAVDILPHDQRTVVLLHHYDHLSYREIAAIVGCSERGVETRLYRALRRLREQLAPQLAVAPAPS